MVLVGQNIRNCTSCPHMQFHTLHTKHRTVKTPAPDTVAAGGGQGPGRERSCCGRARLQTPAAFGWLGSPAAALLPRAVSAPRARRAEEQEQARTAAAGCARRSGRKTASSAPPLLRGAAAGAPWPGLGRGQGRRALASRSPLQGPRFALLLSPCNPRGPGAGLMESGWARESICGVVPTVSGRDVSPFRLWVGGGGRGFSEG